MLLSTNLKSLRKSQKLTLLELSKATGLSIASLSAYETGQYCPSVESLLILANFYTLSLDTIVGRPSSTYTKRSSCSSHSLQSLHLTSSRK